MFEFNPNAGQSFGFHYNHGPMDRRMQLVYRAIDLFNRSYVRGCLKYIIALIVRHNDQLLDLNDIPGMHATARYYEGFRPVLLSQIRGTLGRARDFDTCFNPLNHRSRDRWVGVATALLQGMSLDPVELIRIGNRYFVQDGHHRISVAHALRRLAIDAEVTAWAMPHTLAWKISESTGKHNKTA